MNSRQRSRPRSVFGMRNHNAMKRSSTNAARPVSRKSRAWRTATLAGAIAAAANAVLAALALSPAVSQAQSWKIGERFSFAQTVDAESSTSAPAFAGNDRAFWAGVCDLANPSTTGDGVGAGDGGTAPPSSYSNCIDHPHGDFFGFIGAPPRPPLAPGVDQILVDPVTGASGSGGEGWSGGDTAPFAPDPTYPVPSWRLDSATAAGGHPDGSAAGWFSRSPLRGKGETSANYVTADGSPRDIAVKLPPGVVGNLNAVPMCPANAVRTVPTTCHPKTQVGVATASVGTGTGVYPVYSVEPRDGKTAEFVVSGPGIGSGLSSNVPIVATARTDDDFGVEAMAIQIPMGLPLMGQTVTFWGVPWAASHDRYRPVVHYCSGNFLYGDGMPVGGLPGGTVFVAGKGECSQEPQSYDPSWGPIRSFLTTQTDCSDADPTTSIVATNWYTDTVASETSVAPRPTDCGDVPFGASLSARATSSQADGPTGLDVGLTVPQRSDPPAGVQFNPDDATGAPAFWRSAAGRATSHLDKTVVALPDGVSVNPSGATGLAGCSDAEIGLRRLGNPPLFNNGDPFDGDLSDGAECPAGSVIGTAEVTTPLLEEKLTGQVVLGSPKSTDPQSGDMFRLFLVLRNRERGLVAKVYGSTVADPTSGRLTATFDNNPQLPFDDLQVRIKGGERGMLALPQGCVSRGWSAELTPWSGNAPEVDGGAFTTSSNCANGFSPALVAGMDTQAARGSGTFSFRFSRQDGEQYLRGLTATLPQGLLASVRNLPLCSNAAANAGACPTASRIGIVDAKAGSGEPFVLEDKGEVFLTEGYKDGAYGLAVKIRPIAGPFRGAMELSPIVVRQAIHVDRKTAQVTATSDPFPLIHHGVPLRVREVTVLVNRGGFMLNPSACAAKQIVADIQSDRGTTAHLTNGFQADGCKSLEFEPKLALRLTGRKQVRTGKHPGIRATVTQKGIPEAGIERAEVRLPKSLALDVENAQALCEFEAGTKPDLENHCPKGSIVGRARAVSPLLDDPLVGNVYFVKNVRRSGSGNLIRTLPMIVVALRGEIAVNLTGESNVNKGRLVNTFDKVPDAPISRFNLNIKGGKNGILAVTRTRRGLINLCAKPKSHIAEADMDGHNGRRRDRDIRMKTPCAKKAKAQRRKAAKRKAAANRRKAQRRVSARR
jgi:hypothetical protein